MATRARERSLASRRRSCYEGSSREDDADCIIWGQLQERRCDFATEKAEQKERENGMLFSSFEVRRRANK